MKINKKKTQIAICIALALGIVANIFTYTTFTPLFRGAGMNFFFHRESPRILLFTRQQREKGCSPISPPKHNKP